MAAGGMAGTRLASVGDGVALKESNKRNWRMDDGDISGCKLQNLKLDKPTDSHAMLGKASHKTSRLSHTYHSPDDYAQPAPCGR